MNYKYERPHFDPATLLYWTVLTGNHCGRSHVDTLLDIKDNKKCLLFSYFARCNKVSINNVINYVFLLHLRQ